RPFRFFHTPPIITASIFARLVCITTVETGSCTGTRLRSLASMTTRSASLPGVSEPIWSSRPSMRAPSIVIQRSASRTGVVVVAVHDVNSGADETRLDQLLPATLRLGGTAALMHRCDQLELACHAEIVHGDVQRRIMRAEDREPKRDEAVAVGEGSRQQPLDL